LIFGLIAALHAFEGLNHEVEAAIVAALGTVVVTLVSVLLSRFFERRSAVERVQQERRMPVYEEFITGLLEVLAKGAKDPAEVPTDEGVRVLEKFTQTVMVWGSDDVIRTWGQYRYALRAAKTEEERTELTYELERLFLTLRRDLGHKNRKLVRGDLLKLFINDLPDSEAGTVQPFRIQG